MSKTAVFELQPTIFFSASETYTYDDGPSAYMLAGWHLRHGRGRKYGIIPISEVVPFKQLGLFRDDVHRTSDHVRISKVTVLFTAWRSAHVRFTCFLFRHGQRAGEALSISTRPHVDSVKYLELSGPRQPVSRLLFKMMDESEVVDDCGETIIDIAHGRCGLPTSQGPIGQVVARNGCEDYHSCGSMFDEYLNSTDSTMFIRTHIVIELWEDEYFASSETSRSIVSQPLEMFVGMDDLSTDFAKVASIDLPIVVSVEFEDVS